MFHVFGKPKTNNIKTKFRVVHSELYLRKYFKILKLSTIIDIHSIISTLKFPLLNLCMHLFCACSIVQEVHFTPTMKFVLVNYEQTQTWTPEHIWIRF